MLSETQNDNQTFSQNLYESLIQYQLQFAQLTIRCLHLIFALGLTPNTRASLPAYHNKESRSREDPPYYTFRRPAGPKVTFLVSSPGDVWTLDRDAGSRNYSPVHLPLMGSQSGHFPSTFSDGTSPRGQFRG